jgi:MFS family permease
MSDRFGKYKIFVTGSLVTMVMVAVYTNLGITPFWIVVALNVLMLVGVSSRLISSSALMTAVPEPQDRGAFMSINSSVQQIAGGIASAVAGLIVVQTKAGPLKHYNVLGYVVLCSMTVTLILMYYLNRYVQAKTSATIAPPIVEEDRALVLD